jgi:subtilisin family serine protease
MPIRFFLLPALVLLTLAPFAAADEYVPGELLVILNDPSVVQLDGEGRPSGFAPGLAPLLERQGIDHLSWITEKTTMSERDRTFVRLSSDRPDFDVLAAREALAATGLFRAVSPNYLLHVLLTPNDPMLGSQWHITNGTSGIKLPQAWNLTTGDTGVVIAILDTGVDYSHPDLAGNAWVNPDEIAGNGTDDDGNGYVDDIHGWDCGQNDNDPRPAPYHEGGIDVGFHGTHCAGIASAATNNATGVAGAGYSCKLMGLKVTNGDNFALAAIATGFNYAMEELPDVISMSFGGTYAEFGFMQALIDDATDAGIICVAAAGNNNTSEMLYPAALNHVISVGATNSANQRASFSTYGNWVDVAAPGEQIWSTIQSNYEFDFLTGFLFQLSYGWDGVNPYMYSDGTSMACPLVAGVCALVRSVAPAMDHDAMEQHLKATGDTVSYDQPIGIKVNAYNAVNIVATAIAGADEVAPAATRFTAVRPNPFNPAASIDYALAERGPVRLAIYDVNGRRVRTLVDGAQQAGPQNATWDGRADGGGAMPSGVYFARLTAAGRSISRKLVLIR